jgi:two-component system OmpR family sensor kinase
MSVGCDSATVLVAAGTDDASLAERLARASDGLAPVAVTTGTDALARLDGADCVLAAADLPDMTGLDLFEAVRERDGAVPFVLFERAPTDGLAARAMAAGVDDYARADDPDAALAARLERVVSGAGAERRARERRDRAHDRIRSLAAFTSELHGCETEAEALELAADAARDVLAFDRCSLGIERDGYLHVEEERGGDHGAHMRLPADEGIAGETYVTGEPSLVDRAVEHPAADAGADDAALVSVPIGEHGVFQAVADGPGAFDEGDLEVATLLGEHLAEALSRIERERELERQNERLDEFASVVSHDLRSPLNVAEGRIELARETGALDHLEEATAALDHMDDLIDDALTLARDGRAVETPEPVAFGTVVRSAWRGIPDADAELVVEDADVTVLADEGRLRRAVGNVLRNAVEHGATSPREPARGDAVEHGSTGNRAVSDDAVERAGAAPTVRAGAERDGGTVTLFVADDGPGIPPEDRVEATRSGYSTASDGTGLGLGIVRRIADAHGWTLSLDESEAGGLRVAFAGVEPADERDRTPDAGE